MDTILGPSIRNSRDLEQLAHVGTCWHMLAHPIYDSMIQSCSPWERVYGSSQYSPAFKTHPNCTLFDLWIKGVGGGRTLDGRSDFRLQLEVAGNISIFAGCSEVSGEVPFEVSILSELDCLPLKVVGMGGMGGMVVSIIQNGHSSFDWRLKLDKDGLHFSSFCLRSLAAINPGLCHSILNQSASLLSLPSSFFVTGSGACCWASNSATPHLSHSAAIWSLWSLNQNWLQHAPTYSNITFS